MKEIQLTKGLTALVDDDDFELLNQFHWFLDNKGYVICNSRDENGNRIKPKMHRVVLGLSKGDGKTSDHINGIKTDNRKGNLRSCLNSQNCQNQNIRLTNKTGFKGVSFRASSKNYVAQISVNGKNKFIGYFSTPISAYEAYCIEAKKLHGEFANLGNGSVVIC